MWAQADTWAQIMPVMGSSYVQQMSELENNSKLMQLQIV